MRKITLLAMVFLTSVFGAFAQGGNSVSCTDLNGYPQSKNVGATGAYTLTFGQLENAAQTYHYSGPGNITSVRIFGSSPNVLGVPMRARVYTVDANGRPVSVLASQNFTWTITNNVLGYHDVFFGGGGVPLSSNFAVSAEIIGGFPAVTQFAVGYNGDGDGNGEDLASLGGSTTGFVWQSANSSFGRDGDFYIIPRMNHFITSNFTTTAQCVNVGESVAFTNQSFVTQSGMFNTINLPNYSGSQAIYNWNFGDATTSTQANPTKTYTAAGVYTVSLTVKIDGWNNDCSATFTRQISVGLNAGSTSISNATCFGSANGSFTATATGGAAPYTYSINGTTYQSSASFTGLSAGVYTLYVKDNLGCVKTSTVTINQPSQITWTTTNFTNATCGTNSDGAILLAAVGGTGSLQYSINGTSWQTSGSFTGLAAGSYTVYVKDANNCQNTATVNISNAGAPTLVINSVTNVTCNGSSTGSIILSSSGGTGTPQYSIDGTNYQTSGTFTNLAAGTYSVYVKDQAGCIDVKSVTIIQPNPLVFTTSTTPVSCYEGSNGSITISTVSGGTGTPVYSLNGTNYQSSNVFNGLAAGTYTVYVRDVAQCIATASVTVVEPTAITLTTAIVNNTCNGGNNGTITVTANGGNGGYQYSLNGVNFQPTPVFSNLFAGTYTVTVKDAKNCTATVSATVTQPSIISAVITTGATACGNTNGTILVSASGGSGSGYQYSLDGVNFTGVGSFAGLAAGTYPVVVKDGAGCIRTFSATIVNTTGPSINSVSSTNITCNGGDDGSITVTSVSGGTGTLTYSINGSPFQTSTVFTGLTAGSYVVVVKDALGCTGSYSTITLTQPSQIAVSTQVTNVNCFGSSTGSVLITAGGGSGFLSYSIDGFNFQSSSLFTGLPAGEYAAFVKDQGNCLSFATFTISQPSAITISNKGILNVSCNGGNDGSMLITASGGTGALQYSIDGVNFSSNNSFTGLTAGSYIVYVKDANGCVIMSLAQITQPAPMVASANVYNVSCAGGNNGVIDFVVFGGVAPYTFQWSNGNNTEDIFNLTPGQYNIDVTDANGCTISAGYTISQPNNPIVVNGTVNNATGLNASNGGIDITVSGGTLPYSFEWSNGAVTEDLTGVPPGAYLVTITDYNGCEVSAFYNVGVSVGIDDVEASEIEVNAYPVPADYLITFDAADFDINRIDLLNMYGQVVYSVNPNMTNVQVDISHLAAGVYFAKITVSGQTITKKIQVNR